MTTGAGAGLDPRKHSPKACEILDVDGNRKYQWINSLQELLLLSGGGDGLADLYYEVFFDEE
ncbi:MAG: hypothetical protein L3J49_06055 [Desulfobulbaceae bacterium]|nr:hypothetical protein [Desulfobulbaceae bacterium]